MGGHQKTNQIAALTPDKIATETGFRRLSIRIKKSMYSRKIDE